VLVIIWTMLWPRILNLLSCFFQRGFPRGEKKDRHHRYTGSGLDSSQRIALAVASFIMLGSCVGYLL